MTVFPRMTVHTGKAAGSGDPAGHGARHILEAANLQGNVELWRYTLLHLPENKAQVLPPSPATLQGRAPAPGGSAKQPAGPSNLAGRGRPWLHGRLPWDDGFCSSVPPSLACQQLASPGSSCVQGSEMHRFTYSPCILMVQALPWPKTLEQGKTQALSPGVYTALSWLNAPTSILTETIACLFHTQTLIRLAVLPAQ